MKAPLGSILTGKGLRARAIRSAGLTVVSFGGAKVLRLVSNLILTRLLFPEAFGLMALVMVVITGLQMFSDMGLRLSIIQNTRGDDPDFLNTAWTMQIGRGFFLWLMTCALALPAAQFYDEPMLSLLLPVVGLKAVIQGFKSTRVATANRHLMLGRVTALGFSGQVITIVVTAILAYLTHSVWSLVFGMLVSTLVTVILSHIVLPGLRNRLCFDRGAFLELFGFGKYIFISTIAGFLISQGDRAILGKFVPLAELAVYNIAFMLATVPFELNRTFVNRIVLPLYRSRPPAENPDNKAKIARARYMLTGFVMASTVPLAFFGDAIIRTLYDPRYHDAGAILVLISVAMMPTLIVAAYRALPLAAGDSGRFAVLNVCDALLRTGFLLSGISHFGVVGAALAPAFSALLYYPVNVALLYRYRAWDPLHDLLFTIVSAAIAGAALWFNADLLTGFVSARL